MEAITYGQIETGLGPWTRGRTRNFGAVGGRGGEMGAGERGCQALECWEGCQMLISHTVAAAATPLPKQAGAACCEQQQPWHCGLPGAVILSSPSYQC